MTIAADAAFALLHTKSNGKKQAQVRANVQLDTASFTPLLLSVSGDDGESEPAVVGQSFALLNGQSDPALSPEGEAEASKVCERLVSEHIDAIYVSTLRRTAQTAG